MCLYHLFSQQFKRTAFSSSLLFLLSFISACTGFKDSSELVPTAEDITVEDTTTADTGVEDTATTDTGVEDTATADTGVEDTATTDIGVEDTGGEDVVECVAPNTLCGGECVS